MKIELKLESYCRFQYLGGESIQEFTANRKTSLCRIYVCNYVRKGKCGETLLGVDILDVLIISLSLDRKGNCNMDNYHNWTLPMLMDDTSCGVACPSEGCFWDNP